MSKGKTHDDFDFGEDLEFQENFNKNIDRVFSDIFDASEEEVSEPAANESEEALELADKANEEALEPADKASEEALEPDVKTSEETLELVPKENEEATEIVVSEENEGALDTLETSDEIESDDIEKSFEELAAAAAQIDDVEVMDETLIDINSSLAKQIGEELESLEAGVLRNRKKSRMMKIQIGVIIGLLSLLGIAFFFGFTKPGNQLLIKMGVNIAGKIWDAGTQDFTNDDPEPVEDVDHLEEDDIASDSEEIDPNEIEWPNSTGYGRREEGVYNVLLLGEEAIESGSARGRTDLIIIATLNKNSKSIKLTSIMRDTLVQIPGYKENKINAAYEKGDVGLLYETIALNFNTHIDGCILVNFENFEKIIDSLGGLELTLTKAEAKYLRNTNYISNPAYRTVVEGKQLMNGNQVLGYSRVRKRAAITGANNDYGRTDRHRIILNAIFDKYKTKSKLELAALMLQMIPIVKTDIDSKTFEELLNTFIEMGTMEINQLRLPADGTFTDNVKVRGLDVLIPDLSKNIDILHEFIFGNK